MIGQCRKCINFRDSSYSHKKYSTTAVPNLFGTRDRFRGRQFFHWLGRGQGGPGGNASDGEAGEVSLARLSFTSCCVAQFLTGCGPLAAHGLGVGAPALQCIIPVPWLYRILPLWYDLFLRIFDVGVSPSTPAPKKKIKSLEKFFLGHERTQWIIKCFHMIIWNNITSCPK